VTSDVTMKDVVAFDATCKSPADAGKLLLPPCLACLETSCASDLAACLCDPGCVAVIACTEGCVVDGGAENACAISCSTRADSSASGARAVSLFVCSVAQCQTDASGGCDTLAQPPDGGMPRDATGS
jgi:hypothetical protein